MIKTPKIITKTKKRLKILVPWTKERILQNIDAKRINIWAIRGLFAVLITIILGFLFKLGYRDSWEIGSLIWSAIYLICFVLEAPKAPNSSKNVLLNGLAGIFTVPIALLIFSTILIRTNLISNEIFVNSIKNILNFAPVTGIIGFAFLDLFLFLMWNDELRKLNRNSNPNVNLENSFKKLRLKSKYFFIFVDIPSFVSVIIFTLYYLILVVYFNSIKHTSTDSLTSFFAGATALQLIAANITFAFIDSYKKEGL